MARGDFDEALRIRTDEELPVYTTLGDARSALVCRANIALTLARRGHLADRPRIQHLLAQALSVARTMRLPEATMIEFIQRDLNLPIGETSPE